MRGILALVEARRENNSAAILRCNWIVSAIQKNNFRSTSRITFLSSFCSPLSVLKLRKGFPSGTLSSIVTFAVFLAITAFFQSIGVFVAMDATRPAVGWWWPVRASQIQPHRFVTTPGVTYGVMVDAQPPHY